jgi:hypothetical protein
MNDRPHPCLLPQEKEKRPPVFGGADAPGYRAVFPAKEKETALTRGAAEFSRDAQNFSLSLGERVRVRASVKTILCFALLFCFITTSSLFAQNTITNVMSPVVSYQYYDALGTDTNSKIFSLPVSYQFYDSLEHAGTNSMIISPVASYQYFDWPDASSVHFINSPLVSYYWQFGNSSGPLVLHGRVTDANGNPLSGATVAAMIYLSPVAQATTDANGNYQMPSLGAGVYDLSAWDATHQTSMRALTLNANTAQQNFQLKPLPSTPATQQVIRSATVNYTVGDVMGSRLRIFDGSAFVPITANNWPSANLKTIVMTHGWVFGIPNSSITNTPFDRWPVSMAVKLQAQGVNPANANILAWDWRYAAMHLGPGIPGDRTSKQGIALGEALQYFLGANYSQPLHFLGHSLGTLVNASALDYLHGEKPGTHPQTTWQTNLVHVTLFDHAQVATVAVGVGQIQGPLPHNFTWADNYESLVSFNLPRAVNVVLQKGVLITVLNPLHFFDDSHGCPRDWYGMSINLPSDQYNPLGFKRSYEYAPLLFPPSDIQTGNYHQSPFNDDELALEPATFVDSLGPLPDAVLQTTIDTMLFTGDSTIQIVDTVQNKVSGFFNYVGGVAAQGGQAVVNFFDSAVLRLRLHTTPPSSPGLIAFGGTPHPMGAGGPHPQGGGGASDSPPMAWLPIQFPSNATAMAFDFTVEGNPMDDVLVCGVGTNNLFSLEAKDIPTNTMSASRLIDVSAWAGTTNELFFGFMGGTSTNATLTIENIRFYSLAQPRLEISTSGNVTLLSWPSTAGGYVVESTPTLASPIWEAVTNAPVISGSSYILTNYWSDQTRFFRLHSQ